ncbi:MAG TPA: cupin domain-containing protein, partial [Pseudolabrys sp.]|nr:cupin domain-containing protein [Pseudolabrys sp.]
MFTRRDALAAAAVGGVVTAAAMTPTNAAPVKSDITFGNPDDPPQGAVNATNPRSVTDPGPQNPAIRDQFPAAFSPPATDTGSMPLTWASFNNAPRRIQNGGWARQVTQDSFAVASTISGVNMRLTSGGIREMHWHQFAEWAYMTYGTCRITILDEQGRPYIADVKEGDLWYFPAGLPHSLQGLGPDGCEFLICFDDGNASEFSTLLVSEWFTHTPPDVLGANFGVPPDTFQNIPLRDLYIFQGKLPGDLAAERDAVSGRGVPPHPFTFSLGSAAPARETKGGSVRIADSKNFTVATTVAAALVTVHPGGMREMHWHPHADEWQYWIKGKGQMTVFNTGPNAVTMDFNPGDIGYVKKNLGHYIKNVGDTDLQ